MTLPTSQVLATMVQVQYRTEHPFRVSIDLLKDLKQMGNQMFGTSGMIKKKDLSVHERQYRYRTVQQRRALPVLRLPYSGSDGR
jgi:hypothetical protein